jgi:catechol 2,3-dioxygenase-like lactoylglutathione lyase family enzyme
VDRPVLKRLILGLLAFVLGVAALLAIAIFAFRPGDPAPMSIDFTRHLVRLDGAAAPANAEFVATPGAARLQVTCAQATTRLGVQLNGVQVLDPAQGIDCAKGIELPVTLVARNRLAISTDASTAAATTLRIRQLAEVQMHVLSRVHYNVNVTDFEASRAFYGKLGFSTVSGFPDTNTQAMARAIGIKTPTAYDGSQGGEAGGYLLHGELIGLGGFGGAIDLIEFTIPRSEEPPYAALNRLGMARAALLTRDIDADYRTLAAQGVRFLSPPATRADGSRFVIFTDPDGTFHELVQPAGATAADGAPPDGRPTHIHAFGPLTVNASDFERSRAWYQMFGYELTRKLPANASGEEAKALGFAQPVRIEGALLTHAVDGSTMELVQWLAPYDPTPPYPLPVNHIGIHRTALATTDIAADVATLEAQGVIFVSPITPCCSGPDSSGSIVAFLDPDGTIVELVEQPMLSLLMPSMMRIGRLFE